MRIVFLGTPEFAVPSLEMLVEEKYDVVGVFTQPDRPKGRGKKLSPTPVKECALRHRLDVYQFERIKGQEGVAKLRELQPDLMITAAFGQILSRENLEIPPLGCINVHASLLPKYRGPAPIQWAIINGETRTGITTMYTDIGVDTGDIILQKEIEIYEDETAGELYQRLAGLGAQTLKETLECIKKGVYYRIPQDSEQATYYPMIRKSIGDINWNQEGRSLKNLVRGLDPWPGAYTCLGDQTIKIWKLEPVDIPIPDNCVPGQVIVSNDKQGLVIAVREGAVAVVEMQAAGGKRMSSKDYLRGRDIPVGTVLKKCGGL